ncbi:hypothetical protein DFS34DRAFT_647431 [Phlyctochytrium arcticum]|nr:hypothetical protein DFS34DRAFT_647431 [Phlyctochytrium arcticum]
MNKISIPHKPSLQLFRDALRAARTQNGYNTTLGTLSNPASASHQKVEPPRAEPHQRKLRANVRELFEFYRTETRAEKVQELLNMGKHDIEVLKALALAEDMCGLGRNHSQKPQE